MRNLLIRTVSGTVYVALMVAAVFTPWVAVPLLLFLTVVGLYEFYKLCPNPKLRWVGPIWIVLPLCLLFLLWIPKNPAQVLAFLILIWASDTFAYLGGSLFGKHKLAPSISPGKTWEGFLISCVLTAALAVGISYIPYFKAMEFTFTVWHWVVMALLVEVFGLMGDLIESLFKRKAGVKDSGKIIPGHGGVLDRVDSILFAAVPVWLFCLMV
jgi:phosphatidate cytidylyltransferase